MTLLTDGDRTIPKVVLSSSVNPSIFFAKVFVTGWVVATTLAGFSVEATSLLLTLFKSLAPY